MNITSDNVSSIDDMRLAVSLMNFSVDNSTVIHDIDIRAGRVGFPTWHRAAMMVGADAVDALPSRHVSEVNGFRFMSDNILIAAGRAVLTGDNDADVSAIIADADSIKTASVFSAGAGIPDAPNIDTDVTSETSKLWAIETILSLKDVPKGQKLMAIELIVHGHSGDNFKAALAWVSKRNGASKLPREIVRIGMLADGDVSKLQSLCDAIHIEEKLGWYNVLAVTPDYAVIEWTNERKFAVIGIPPIETEEPLHVA